jgi:hypothetical protein
MQKIDISIRERNPLYFDKSQDMITALAWNAVKKTLIEAKREELFEEVKSVKVTEKYITVHTGKPMANSEIQMHAEHILWRLHISLSSLGIETVKLLRLK